MDMSQYEQYLIYNKPIPYMSEKSLKRRQEIENEIIKLNNNKTFNENNDEEIKSKLSQLQEEYEKLILLIYPVKMIDYLRFYTSVNCLSFDKNKIPDPKVISMSYLDFIFHLIENDPNGKYYALMLCDVLNLCCKIEINKISYRKSETGKINLIIEKDENEEVINANDFENIKNIILKQNIPDYDDSYIDPKIEEVLKETEEFLNRHKKKMASLEDQIICVMLALHETNEEKIHNLTIRKFSKILQRYDFKLHYEIYKTAEMGGMVTFKQEIDHWMSEISNKKYSSFDNTIVEYDALKSKIESAT